MFSYYKLYMLAMLRNTGIESFFYIFYIKNAVKSTSKDPDSQHWYNGLSVDKILRHFNLISLNLFQGRKLSWRLTRRKLRSLRLKQLKFCLQVHELLIKNNCYVWSVLVSVHFTEPDSFLHISLKNFLKKISVTDLGSRIWCFFYPWILFRFF